jgi:hyperosmotically inducible protein
MKKHPIHWFSGVVLSGILILAPLADRAHANQTANPSQGQVAPVSALSPLETAVRHELLMLPYYGVFDNLEFKVDGDKVELSGQVARPVLASDAVRAVARLKGVGQVINHIEVLPVSFYDDRIRLGVYRKVYGDQAMLLYHIQPVPPIRIIVKNGNVTLEGVVGRSMDKIIANLDANSVGGVFRVTNNLRVQS